MIPAGRYIAVRIIAAMEDGCSPESTIATRAPHHAISIAYRPWVHRDPLVFPPSPLRGALHTQRGRHTMQ